MIKRGRKMVGATAGALIHEHHVHSRRQPFFSDSKHVFRFRRSLKPVNNDHGECTFAVRLPVTMAKHVNTRLNFNESLVGFQQRNAPRKQETGQRLDVPARKETARPELPACLELA